MDLGRLAARVEGSDPLGFLDSECSVPDWSWAGRCGHSPPCRRAYPRSSWRCWRRRPTPRTGAAEQPDERAMPSCDAAVAARRGRLARLAPAEQRDPELPPSWPYRIRRPQGLGRRPVAGTHSAPTTPRPYDLHPWWRAGLPRFAFRLVRCGHARRAASVPGASRVPPPPKGRPPRQVATA